MDPKLQLIIHLTAECIIIGGVTFWLNTKIRSQEERITELDSIVAQQQQRIDRLEHLVKRILGVPPEPPAPQPEPQWPTSHPTPPALPSAPNPAERQPAIRQPTPFTAARPPSSQPPPAKPSPFRPYPPADPPRGLKPSVPPPPTATGRNVSDEELDSILAQELAGGEQVELELSQSSRTPLKSETGGLATETKDRPSKPKKKSVDETPRAKNLSPNTNAK